MTSDAPSLKRVLLVDDDKVTNLMHGRMIKRTGLVDRIDVATDGVAALDYLKETAARGETLPELILLDINMPRMGGFEFLEHYAALPAHIQSPKTIIIMLSTSVLRADHERAEKDRNVHRFMCKPATPEDFESFVAEYQDVMSS
ncbi:response regulator [Roseobacter sp. YSTF-M11]|uniref:Response regulator n=1 Tax=Roseobacter insulae TaxID=2859783 RepID=A0A9X1K2P6_9RHOB|nr:response regulator [Roseobacter insulae]MBW4710489.1 response regulator [Roseobacter insulae]